MGPTVNRTHTHKGTCLVCIRIRSWEKRSTTRNQLVLSQDTTHVIRAIDKLVRTEAAPANHQLITSFPL